MRVALSLLTLVPGEMGGSETYVRGLARGLATQRTVDVIAFVPALAPDAAEGLPMEIVAEYRSATTAAGRLRAMAEASVRPGRLRSRFEQADVVHFPLTVPVPATRLPVVITLHDVQHLDLPRLFSRAQRLYRRVAYDRAARRAAAVIVPSEFVRGRAVALLGLDPDRVHVIPHGLDHAVFRPGPEERESFLLYPARAWPHKNHERLLAAFALIRRDRPRLRLVLTGGGTERLAGPTGVEALGSVPLATLVGLYARAACVVFPSLYEGFGAPPLEAMASGAPVAASSAGSLPEVCGVAAVLFDPRSPEGIAAGVEEALERAEELRQLGIAHAAGFTWESSARAHAEVYRATAE